MASSGLGDFPLVNSRVTREGLTGPVDFGNAATAAATALADFFFGSVSGVAEAHGSAAGTSDLIAVSAAIAASIANAAGAGTAEAEGAFEQDTATDTDASAVGAATVEATAASIASAAGFAAGAGEALATAESPGAEEETPTAPSLDDSGGGGLLHPDLAAARRKRKPRVIRMGEAEGQGAEAQAEADFRTLWEAVKIRDNPGRLNAVAKKRAALLADLDKATLIRKAG